MTPEKYLMNQGYTPEQISRMSIPQRRAAATRLNNKRMRQSPAQVPRQAQIQSDMQMQQKLQQQERGMPGQAVNHTPLADRGMTPMKPSNMPKGSQVMGGMKSSVSRQKEGLLG